MSVYPGLWYCLWSMHKFVFFKQTSSNIRSQVYQTPSRVHFLIEDSSILNADFDSIRKEMATTNIWMNACVIFIDTWNLTISSIHSFTICFNNIEYFNHQLRFFSLNQPVEHAPLDAINENFKIQYQQIFIPLSNQAFVISTVTNMMLATSHLHHQFFVRDLCSF